MRSGIRSARGAEDSATIMDLQEILDRKIRELPPGPHSDGLRAVKSHIDAAVRHFARAQTEGDDPLFTDAIYRCNQAFEGSIKEAYRILANKDPQKKRPQRSSSFLRLEICCGRKSWTNLQTTGENGAALRHTIIH
jgi:hypothetical protein